MSKLVPFTFETAEVRAILRDGEPWFVGKDVAEILGYANPQKAVRDHCKHGQPIKQVIRGVNDSFTPELDVQTIVIPERDLYRLIMRSKLPAAERFEEWVVAEVLPSIRKTGRYDTGEARRDASVAYKMMCETLQDSRKASGKDTRAHHYINEARLINAALTGAFQGIERARLNRTEFDLLIRLEHENEFLLRQEKPYAERKTFLIDYANQYRQRAALKPAATKPVLERRPA